MTQSVTSLRVTYSTRPVTLRTMRRLVLCLAGSFLLGCARPAPRTPAVEVARAYLEAARDRDVDRMSALVAPHATAFELGDEGSFTRYRDDHLAPELARLRTIAMTLGEPTEREASDHTLATVWWPIRRFTMARVDGTLVDARGAATFVLAPCTDGWIIEHVHFSLHTEDTP